ncbi:DUF4232 domain-containing protein [Microlunatus sp. Gsoil 973]|uniref:DUF4232 domain-containing protein n=1 Tax=Microlunatus sp. Gsoil 973 TaxID=2672569 RepID=UPI0012B4EB43|nr:DUF4232 domain-containing protein [Microlunatus sp. Gsoil 973]QGN32538.1 DUF4232 domain-containing protein [Microlunatus sp. Gsoil 973]
MIKIEPRRDHVVDCNALLGTTVESVWQHVLVPRRLLFWLVAALTVVGAVLIVWRPWDACDAPGELCSAVEEIKKSPDVVDAGVSYEITRTDPKDGDAARAGWTVRLSSDLTPDRAGAAATRAEGVIHGRQVHGVDIHHFIDIVAGEPRGRKIPVYPLDVTLSDDPAVQVSRGFELLQHGASRVSAGAAEATDTDGLLALAGFAASRGYPTSLATADGSVRYETTETVAPDKVRLVVDVAELNSVGTVVLSVDGRLEVHTTRADRSPEAVIRWLEKRHPPGGDPMAYTLTGPGYAAVRGGWVGAVTPPAPKPHPAALPPGVEPWPADTAAPDCAGKDLKVTLSSPDAAAGRRFMAVLARNVSQRPCAVSGAPGIQFLQADGTQQVGVSTAPSSPGVIGSRVVVPVGERLIATLEWGASSSGVDSTTSVQITAVPGAVPIRLIPRFDGAPTTLDVLDDAEVKLGPWAQAVDGWSKR